MKISGEILKITQNQADKAIKQLRSIFDIVRILKENEIAGESHLLKEGVPHVNAMNFGKRIKHAIIAFQQIHLKLKKITQK